MSRHSVLITVCGGLRFNFKWVPVWVFFLNGICKADKSGQCFMTSVFLLWFVNFLLFVTFSYWSQQSPSIRALTIFQEAVPCSRRRGEFGFRIQHLVWCTNSKNVLFHLVFFFQPLVGCSWSVNNFQGIKFLFSPSTLSHFEHWDLLAVASLLTS